MTRYFNHTIQFFPLSLVLMVSAPYQRHIEKTPSLSDSKTEDSALTFHYPLVESPHAAALRLFEGSIPFICHHDTSVDRAGFL